MQRKRTLSDTKSQQGWGRGVAGGRAGGEAVGAT